VVFKAWHLLLFALVPLALVFAGVIGGAFRGVDSEPEVFSTAAPALTSAPAATTGGAASGAVVLNLSVKDVQFDKRTLTVPANASVTIRFENKDAAVSHNFAVYTARSATTKVFVGDIVQGPATKESTFTSPGPGTYFFRCDVHPDTMNGSFVVK